MKEYIIRVENVSKVFRMYSSSLEKMKEALSLKSTKRHTDFYAIKDLSFNVERGDVLGIMGRNGAGKSTLLKMITGIYEPTYGKIEVQGRICSLLELGMGFNPEYTGLENIFFYGTLMGFTKNQMEEKVGGIVSFAEIGDYVYQPVKTYSSGMFARLAFSCAINVEPEILIVDEILSVGDMRFQAKCFEKFKEFRQRGVTILYVGHDIGMMRSFCTKAMWLDKGQMVDIGDPTFIGAKFTEFMYLEDISELSEYRLDSKIEPKEEDNQVKKGKNPKKSDKKSKNSLFPESIAHWGTCPELVKSVGIFGIDGKPLLSFGVDQVVSVEISFRLPENVDLEYFSIAFSIKSKAGVDLIVKSTFDEGIRISSKISKVAFTFSPRLSNGDYYLVVAMEDRKKANISYYEYIEGACYFKVYSEKKIFGIFDADVRIQFYD